MSDQQALKLAITTMMDHYIKFERAKNQLNADLDTAYEEYKDNINGVPKPKKLLKAIAKAAADGKLQDMQIETNEKSEILEIYQEEAR